MRWSVNTLALGATLLASAPLHAQSGPAPLVTAPAAAAPAEPRGTVSLTVENDLFGGGSDRHYTNGLLATWRPGGPTPGLVQRFGDGMGWLLGEGELRWGVAVGQNIYTPQHTAYYVPDPDDRPYAGHLYGAFTVSRSTQASQTLFEVQAGVVGPAALGEQVQNNFHRLINVEVSRGWDHQLKDEPVLDLLAERRWRIPLRPFYGTPAELIPEVSASVGNASTYASAGAILRVGTALAYDWGPTRIRPALAGSGFINPSDEPGWYAFVGLEGRAVARDIFLDGNTWRDGPSVDKRPVVGDLQLGVAAMWRGMRLAYTQIIRSEEFYGQRGTQTFGSINLSFRF